MSRWTLAFLLGASVVVAGVIYLRARNTTISARDAARLKSVGCSQVASAFTSRESYAWVTIAAPVTRLLPDEYGTYQHQRFVVRCPSGQTVLITNDVSVGTRVPVIRGRNVVVRGEYIWNAQGGLLHFTHHGGPNGGGWILYGGRIYALLQYHWSESVWARG